MRIDLIILCSIIPILQKIAFLKFVLSKEWYFYRKRCNYIGIIVKLTGNQYVISSMYNETSHCYQREVFTIVAFKYKNNVILPF